MRQNNIFLLATSTKRRELCARRYGLIALGTMLLAALPGFFMRVQAQPAGITIGTPVSTNYVGLRTTNSYQPLPVDLGGALGTSNPPPVHVVPIDDDLRTVYSIDPFYKKTLTCAGVVFIGSDRVSDWAFLEAAYTLDHQLHGSPEWVRAALTTNRVRMAIIADVEYTMDLPENVDQATTVPDMAYQDQRSRGLGGMPWCSCAEENLLNLRGDPYGGNGSPTAGENITIHEFSHTVASAIGSRRSQGRRGQFWTDLNKAYADATNSTGRLGLWNASHGGKVYASQNTQEYWAEGAQAWFDNANPRNSGGISVRDDVKQKDPELAALLAEIYGDGPWKYHKTTAKNADGTTMRPAEELAHLQGLDEVRSQFPVFSFSNSPRIIANGGYSRGGGGRGGRNRAGAAASTNTPAPATPGVPPATH